MDLQQSKETYPLESFNIPLSQWEWLYQPKKFSVSEKEVEMETEPNTDYWQRTYYGFQNNNAHTFFRRIIGDFTFTLNTQFNYKTLYDQSGIVLYQNSENWMKASIEYHNTKYSRIGTVVTNLGYSDWSTTNVPSTQTHVWLRLSRKGQDFKVESSFDGQTFQQMRIFHMHEHIDVAQVGLVACSPMKGSFNTTFSNISIGPSQWEADKDIDE